MRLNQKGIGPGGLRGVGPRRKVKNPRRKVDAWGTRLAAAKPRRADLKIGHYRTRPLRKAAATRKRLRMEAGNRHPPAHYLLAK